MALATIGVAGSVLVTTPTAPVAAPPTAVGSPSSAPARTAMPIPRPPPGESRMHSVAIPEAACPDFRPRRNRVPSGELEGYLGSIVDCLMAANQPGFAEAGFTLTRPTMATEAEVGGSGCISETSQPENWAGLYCPRNATIYYRTDWTPNDPADYLDVLVHEFAHHLQQEAGILHQVGTEQANARRQLNGETLAQQWSRRTELQVECLTGAMVGRRGPMALRARDYAYLVDLRSSVPPAWAATHGTGRAQQYWFERGARAGVPDRYAACNTFTASADTVE